MISNHEPPRRLCRTGLDGRDVVLPGTAAALGQRRRHAVVVPSGIGGRTRSQRGGTGDAVVLYARTSGWARPDVLLGRLRRYAAAHGCAVAAELVDRAPRDLHMAHRPEWRRIERLISLGLAQGIVTPTHDDVRYVDDYLSLTDWLADQHAFLNVTEPVR